jgi:hypothetical protein
MNKKWGLIDKSDYTIKDKKSYFKVDFYETLDQAYAQMVRSGGTMPDIIKVITIGEIDVREKR